jgi:hyperosmotically inducible protein
MTQINRAKRGRLACVVLTCAVILSTALSACAPTVRAATDDATITARVRTLLLNDTQIGALGIDVQTASGVVTISGVVRSPAEERRALDLAAQVEGVRDVKSALQIRQTGT